MDDPSEGCYCIQAQACPHWIAAKMDRRLELVREHSTHERMSRAFAPSESMSMSFLDDQDIPHAQLHEDQRVVINELHRQLQMALMEIKQLAETNKKLAIDNQELEESRSHALNDQARTAQRLTLVSAQVDHMERQLYELSKNEEIDHNPKDMELLRKERVMREELQQRDDENRLQIESLQDEVRELQKSERTVQQKFTTLQGKYDTLSKRYEHAKRQQQELELARESKEALAWLKETTEKLCSPPPESSLGRAIQLERSSQGSVAAMSTQHSSPSSSPPYLSSFIDPPLAAQNQLISLIKELATTNATLRSDVKEYRDLLQDTRNEMLDMQSQLEYYEQGGCENCIGGGGAGMGENDYLHTGNGWGSFLPNTNGLDAVSHIGTLGSVPNSPPGYPRHYPHSFQSGGVRGNVFGELERLYSQGRQPSSKSKRHSKGHSSKRSKRRASKEHRITQTIAEEGVMSTSSEVRVPSKLSESYEADKSSPTTNTSRHRRSVDRGTHSGSESDEEDECSDRDSSGTTGSESDAEEPSMAETNVDAADSGSLSQLDRFKNPPPITLDDGPLEDENAFEHLDQDAAMMGEPDSADVFKPRTNSISLLSAELQRATQSEAASEHDMETVPEHAAENDLDQTTRANEVHPLDQGRGSSLLQGSDVIAEDKELDVSATSWKDRAARMRPAMHEKSISDQGLSASERAQRRLSEPVHQYQPSPSSFSSKKSRPSSIISVRRPRTRTELPGVGVLSGMHGSHGAGSVGMSESQKLTSAELLEHIITEQRQQMMAAWRDGVVAAATTPQPSVSFGEHRKDPDNISIRSKASRRRVRGATQTGTTDITGTSLDQALRIVPPTDMASSAKANDSAQPVQAENQQSLSVPTGDKTPTESTPDPTLGLSKSVVEELRKDSKKRRSVRSTHSVRASILLGARDRRFPSEASAASEVFAERRHNIDQSPYLLLNTLTTELNDRLARTDPRELNRRLQRGFDIQGLSQMSNSLIENILTDIGNLSERFRYLESLSATDPAGLVMEHTSKPSPLGAGSDEDEDDDGSEYSVEEEEERWSFKVTEFFPFTHTVQELLSQNGKLRMTINDLQLSIVQKVEQDRLKAEQEFRDRHLDDDHDFDDPTSDHGAKSSQNRPRILNSTSTGVSGFFSKMFRNNGPPSQRNAKQQGSPQQRTPVAQTPSPSEAHADSPAISKSKSGPVVAETSKVIAQSSGTRAIHVPSSKLSATTTLAAMANTSPARSSTFHLGEGLTSASSTLTSTAALTRTMTMGGGLGIGRPTSPAASAAQDILSRSFSHHRSFDHHPSEEESPVPSKGLPGQNMKTASLKSHTSASLKSHTSTSEDDRSSHRLAAVDENPDQDPASDFSKAVRQDRQSLLVKTAPRSINVTARSATLAMSVVTREDMFQDQWTTSTPSSFSANMSTTVPSRAISERRPTGDSTGVPTVNDPHKGGLSIASLSTNSAVSETMSTLTSRLVSRPTLSTQSAVAVAQSTSAAPSPRDVTSWQGRFPGEPPQLDTTPETKVSEYLPAPEPSRFGPGTSVADTNPAPSKTQGRTQKRRATTSFHPDTAQESIAGGGGGGARLGGRDSIPAFLRGEVQASSLLGSFLQSQSQSRSHSPARGQSPVRTVRKTASKPNLKGKALATDGHSSSSNNNSARESLEIQSNDPEGGYDGTATTTTTTGGYYPTEFSQGEIDPTLMQRSYSSSSRPPLMSFTSLQKAAPARAETTFMGSVVAPNTAGSSATTSTEVAYVVAQPATASQYDDNSRRKIFEDSMIRATHKRILDGTPSQNKVFVPQRRPSRARALSVDSAQSAEVFKTNEILDLRRVGADVSRVGRDIWRGLIKKVDGS